MSLKNRLKTNIHVNYKNLIKLKNIYMKSKINHGVISQFFDRVQFLKQKLASNIFLHYLITKSKLIHPVKVFLK